MKETNLEIVARDTKNYTVRLTQNGVAVDISGWSIYFTVKTNFNDLDASAVLSKNILIPSNAESQAGIAYLPLTSAETNLAIGTYYYDIKLIDTGYRVTFSSGKLNIMPSIRAN
jgi:hypothetical protein